MDVREKIANLNSDDATAFVRELLKNNKNSILARRIILHRDDLKLNWSEI